MKMVKKIIVVFAVLLSLSIPGAAEGLPKKVAFYPIQPFGEEWVAVEANRYLTSILGRAYHLLLPAEFEPLLNKELTTRPDFPQESLYSSLLNYGVGYVLTGMAGTESGIMVYQLKVYDLKTDRCRVFGDHVSVEKDRSAGRLLLKRTTCEVLRYLIFRDRLNLTSQRDSAIALALINQLPKGPKPTVSVALVEKTSQGPCQESFAETALLYYLESCAFPVQEGESLLLREYARFYFANQKRAFPSTLSGEYYIIGTAYAEPCQGSAGLLGAKSQMEVRLLDKKGGVIWGKRIEVETNAQDQKLSLIHI